MPLQFYSMGIFLFKPWNQDPYKRISVMECLVTVLLPLLICVFNKRLGGVESRLPLFPAGRIAMEPVDTCCRCHKPGVGDKQSPPFWPERWNFEKKMMCFFWFFEIFLGRRSSHPYIMYICFIKICFLLFKDDVFLISDYGFPSPHLGNTIFASISTANPTNNTMFGLWFTRIRTKNAYRD